MHSTIDLVSLIHFSRSFAPPAKLAPQNLPQTAFLEPADLDELMCNGLYMQYISFYTLHFLIFFLQIRIIITYLFYIYPHLRLHVRLSTVIQLLVSDIQGLARRIFFNSLVKHLRGSLLLTVLYKLSYLQLQLQLHRGCRDPGANRI